MPRVSVGKRHVRPSDHLAQIRVIPRFDPVEPGVGRADDIRQKCPFDGISHALGSESVIEEDGHDDAHQGVPGVQDAPLVDHGVDLDPGQVVDRLGLDGAEDALRQDILVLAEVEIINQAIFEVRVDLLDRCARRKTR